MLRTSRSMRPLMPSPSTSYRPPDAETTSPARLGTSSRQNTQLCSSPLSLKVFSDSSRALTATSVAAATSSAAAPQFTRPRERALSPSTMLHTGSCCKSRTVLATSTSPEAASGGTQILQSSTSTSNATGAPACFKELQVLWLISGRWLCCAALHTVSVICMNVQHTRYGAVPGHSCKL